MASLTVRNLDDALVRKLRIRAAQNGRSAEAEHREILRVALEGDASGMTRAAIADQLEALQRKLAGRRFPTSAEALAESRRVRMRQLTRSGDRTD
jgi:plasmid stability protein